MARYQGQVAVFRATVPLGVKIPDYQFAAQDGRRPVHAARSGKQLGIVPSELCTDEQFIRRVYARHHRHAADAEAGAGLPGRQRPPDKRDKLIDAPAGDAGVQLLLRQQVGRHPARQARQQPAEPGLRHLRLPRLDSRGDRRGQAVRPVRPRDPRRPSATRPSRRRRSGTRTCRRPTSSWTTPPRCSSALRLACAQCHHHPYEKWSQDDYWGLAAFFGRVGRKNAAGARAGVQNQQNQRQVDLHPVDAATSSTSGPARRPSSKPLDGEPMDHRRRRRSARRSWSTGWSTRRTRSSPGPSPTATGRTSSAAASSIRSTTCASPTRRAIPNCSTPWPRTWSTTSTASST